MSRPGLYANIHAKRKRGGKMRKKGAKGAPKAKDFRGSKAEGGLMEATAKLKRQGLRMGGAVCKIAKRGQNRDAIGKNS